MRARTDNEIRHEAKLTLDEAAPRLEPWRLARLDQLAAAFDFDDGITLYRSALGWLNRASTPEEAELACDMAYIAALVIWRDG